MLEQPSFKLREGGFIAAKVSEELDEFVDQLQPEQFKNITDFFNDLPKIQYTINYENSNGTKKTYTIQGLQDFF